MSYQAHTSLSSLVAPSLLLLGSIISSRGGTGTASPLGPYSPIEIQVRTTFLFLFCLTAHLGPTVLLTLIGSASGMRMNHLNRYIPFGIKTLFKYLTDVFSHDALERFGGSRLWHWETYKLLGFGGWGNKFNYYKQIKGETSLIADRLVGGEQSEGRIKRE